MRASSPIAAAFLLGLGCLAGCSAIPPGREPFAVHPPQDPLSLRLALAEPRVILAADEKPKAYKAREIIETDKLGRELVRWLKASGDFARIRALLGRKNPLDRAWHERDDLLVELVLREFRVKYEGHNGWYIPNLINWFVWMIPAWFVATEDYTLSFQADLIVRSVDSSQPIHTARLPVSVGGSFDEFDRGWQILGFITPNNDAENWRLIAKRLMPAARAKLGEALARELYGLREFLTQPAVRKKTSKTLALVVGVTHYEDQVALPPLPYAARDARAVGGALAQGPARLPARQVLRLADAKATRSNVMAALAELRGRLRPNDQCIIYFAGYGTRTVGGLPALLLHEKAGQLTLQELAQELKRIAGRKLVVLSSSFDGKGRSIRRKGALPKLRDLKPLDMANTTVFLAAGRGQDLLTPEHLGAGLFDHHLVRGLTGAADLDGDGRISSGELFGRVLKRTIQTASYHGATQRPLAVGLRRPFVIGRERRAP